MPGCLFDSSLWVALTFAAHPFHKKAGRQLQRISQNQRVCVVRAIELSTLRLITTPTIHRAFGVLGFTKREAIEFLAALYQKAGCTEIKEPEGTRKLWLRLAETESASPKAWMDAYLAAVAMQSDLDFVTLDADFQGFKAHGLSLTLVR